jgi:aminoglycoside phosphotransferase (APT) family kinase protein
MTAPVPALSRTERKAAQRALLRASLPELPTLQEGLGAVFGSDVDVLDRQPNEYASSFPSEIVTCRLSDASVRRVLCKYESGQRHSAFGHRGNIAYEADVYRHLLQPLGSSAPHWYGLWVVPRTGERWLLIEYVDRAVRVANCDDGSVAMRQAARWIGRFHALNEGRVAEGTLAFLKRYDADYYRNWAHRTAVLSSGLHGSFPWLPQVCERFGRAVELLLATTTVIHGEYGPKNTLVRDERVCPVDWESAAIAAGEIDLASLTDGAWPQAVVDECTLAYQRARWPGGAPPVFARRLALARLYWNFRWLGERADWTSSERGQRRLESVLQVAEGVGLVSSGARA